MGARELAQSDRISFSNAEQSACRKPGEGRPKAALRPPTPAAAAASPSAAGARADQARSVESKMHAGPAAAAAAEGPLIHEHLEDGVGVHFRCRRRRQCASISTQIPA